MRLAVLSCRRSHVACLAVLVLAALLPVLAATPPADAAPRVPFDVRFEADDNGAVALFGNNLLTCPASHDQCAATRAGATNLNNNAFVMGSLDTDDDPGTVNSSSDRVVLPDGATVLWAGLYWGARLSAGSGGSAATLPRTSMRFGTPGAAYRMVSSEASFGPTDGDRAYQEFADVTDLVRGAGNGVYWGADVASGRGEDRYAGWSLVIAYRAPGLPLRNLTVFDGFDDVGRDNPQTITISGFRTPVSGPVETQVGMVAYEGDRGSSGDQARLESTQLSTPLSTGTNFFNSTNDDNGTSTAARVPADATCSASTSSGSPPPASATTSARRRSR
jgi:hypothetical protein